MSMAPLPAVRPSLGMVILGIFYFCATRRIAFSRIAAGVRQNCEPDHLVGHTGRFGSTGRLAGGRR